MLSSRKGLSQADFVMAVYEYSGEDAPAVFSVQEGGSDGGIAWARSWTGKRGSGGGGVAIFCLP